MTFGLLALIAVALFTGAAFYVNVVEQPARLRLDDRALLTEWKPSYKRGAAMQAPLALVGFLLAMIAWWQTSAAGFLIGGLAIVAAWPWTLFGIKPTNDALLATEPDRAGPQVRALVVKWGGLHAVRTGLGAVAIVACLWACLLRPMSLGFPSTWVGWRRAAGADRSSETISGDHYAYKASLIGAAHRFELTDRGLSWRIGRRSGIWPYDRISAIRLSYRPVSMQSRRFRADIESADHGRIAILSTSWQTAALMAPQDRDYRAFIRLLHARMKQAASQATLTGGLRPRIYAAAVVLLVLVAMAMAALFIRAIMTGEWAGALFLVGFAALFGWQIGGFISRNRPRAYAFDDLPEALLPLADGDA
jgi:Domain of unknown function (DUF1772)